MKREFSDENFEEFLKRNADNLRMKAPERVWQNLSGELNKGRRRFGIGLSAFFLVASVLGYLTISTNKTSFRPNNQPLPTTRNLPAATVTATTIDEQNRPAQNATAADFRRTASAPQQSRQNIVSKKLAGAVLAAAGQELEKNNLLADAGFTPTIVDDYPETGSEDEVPATKQAVKKTFVSEQRTESPWTIESATNLYLQKRKSKEKRFQTQFYFSPTISYRKLSENKSYLRNTAQSLSPSNYHILYNNVNSMVTHKPDMGFEVGVTEKYSLSQSVRIRAGLQFNVNRYDIKAFKAPYARASIALNNRRTATVDSLWTLANYSNVNTSSSTRSNWLQNYSFQVSAPVGVELALKGNDKMQFGVAATVQPTYVLGDRAYLITTDYKSYTQVPWLLRRWNVNTSFETFVTYQKGRTRWQVGPQVRYQLLSSFISNYPVKENLFDFGLKIGVSVIK